MDMDKELEKVLEDLQRETLQEVVNILVSVHIDMKENNTIEMAFKAGFQTATEAVERFARSIK